MVSLSACGYASVDGDPVTSDPVPLPDRSTLDAGADVETSPAPISSPATDAAKPASTTCQASSLVACLRFEGNTNVEGTQGLAPSESSGVTFVPGKEDLAAKLDSTSAIRFAPNPIFDLPSGSATIEAWIRREATGADAVVFDDDERFSLTISAAGRVWCKSSGGAVVGATDVPTSAWAHVACVSDGDTLRAYLNGVEDASGAGAIASRPAAAAALGGNAPSGEPFVGLIDSFRLFKVARTPAEIAAAAKP